VKALKVPEPLAVEAVDSPDGPRPRWVVWRGKRRAIASVDDEWQIDDEFSVFPFSVSPKRIVEPPESPALSVSIRDARPRDQGLYDRESSAPATGEPQGEISRRYFAVTLENGARLTFYYDWIDRTWWAQRY